MADAKKTYLFVGSYTKGAEIPGITVYEAKFNGDEVAFKLVESVNVSNPTYFTVTNDKKHLLAVSENWNITDSQVHSYRLSQDGSLEKIQSTLSEATVPCYVITDKRDTFVYVANYVGGIVSAFKLSEDGHMTKSAVAKFDGSSNVVADRQEGPHIHTTRLSVDEKYLYAADLGNDRIIKIKCDERLGLDIDNVQTFNTPPGSGPRHLALHPNGQYMYVSTELSNTVLVYKIDAADGSLKQTHLLSTLPDSFNDKSSVAEILLSEDAKFLYVSNRGHDSLAIFSVSTDGSSLKAIGHQSTKGKTPRNFTIFGNILLVANQESDSIVPFKIAQNGSLLEMAKGFACPQPAVVRFAVL